SSADKAPPSSGVTEGQRMRAERLATGSTGRLMTGRDNATGAGCHHSSCRPAWARTGPSSCRAVGVLAVLVRTVGAWEEAEEDEGQGRDHGDEERHGEEAGLVHIVKALDAEGDVGPDRQNDRDPEQEGPELSGRRILRNQREA